MSGCPVVNVIQRYQSRASHTMVKACCPLGSNQERFCDEKFKQNLFAKEKLSDNPKDPNAAQSVTNSF